MTKDRQLLIVKSRRIGSGSNSALFYSEFYHYVISWGLGLFFFFFSKSCLPSTQHGFRQDRLPIKVVFHEQLDNLSPFCACHTVCSVLLTNTHAELLTPVLCWQRKCSLEKLAQAIKSLLGHPEIIACCLNIWKQIKFRTLFFGHTNITSSYMNRNQCLCQEMIQKCHAILACYFCHHEINHIYMIIQPYAFQKFQIQIL